jgi:hypothetical protein
MHVNQKENIPGDGQYWHIHCPECARHAVEGTCCDPA